MNKKDIKKDIFIDIGVFILFIFTMIYKLTHSSPWGDEWIEYTYSQAGILNLDIFRNVVSTFQPPLYNVIMHFYLMINDSLLWFRMFNVFIGIGIGILLYKIQYKLFGKWTSRITLVVLSLCFRWVYYVQECSEYLLMVFFLTLAIYFYISSFESFSYKKLTGFVLSIVGAIYSQYGSFFVILPLAVLYLVGIYKSDKTNGNQKGVTLISYVAALGFFAIPLYIIFVQNQLRHNEIGGHIVPVSLDTVKDIVLVPGRLIGYFFDVKLLEISVISAGLLTIAIVILSVIIVRKSETDWTNKSLILCLWICYLIHFVLVRLQIYAMVNPTLSAGFYDRYSLFYIPLFCVCIPILIREILHLIPEKFTKLSVGVIVVLAVAILSFSVRSIIPNWHKAKDKEFSVLWMNNRGWEDTTYLFGTAQYGFDYFVSHSEGYSPEMMEKVTTEYDLDNLPDRFWCWRTNWDGDGWQEVVDRAEFLGYNIHIYEDDDFIGQLAYCSK